MHVIEVNLLVNSTSPHSLECKSPHWQDSKLAPNSCFLPKWGIVPKHWGSGWFKHESSTAPSPLWLYTWRFIQHRSTVKSQHHKGLEWYFLIERGSQPGLEPTTSQLLWQVSSSLYRLRHHPAKLVHYSYCKVGPHPTDDGSTPLH